MLGKTLTELIGLVNEKKISSYEIYSFFLSRINKHNKKLNVFVDINSKNFLINEGTYLNGIPVAVKDNFCTKDLKTTASSNVLRNFIPQYESTVTKRLKIAGANIIGKTNMDAWAHGSSTETSDFGPSKNPWNLDYAPGGSSGGSAVAVSTYMAPVAIGSETAGSIRQPSAWCGVVGLKPTYGKVSRYGVIAMGSSFDCPGPMSLSVQDSALVMNLIAGKDPYDATTISDKIPDYTKNLNTKRKLTIGIPDEYMKDLSREVLESVERSLQILQKMGHTLKKVSLLDPKYSISVYTILQRAEVSSNLARFDGVRFGNDRSYFAREAKKRMMLGAYTLSHGYYDAFYKKAQKVKNLIINDLKRVFSEVDIIVSSPTPTTAIKLGEFYKYPFFGETMDVLNEAAAVAGTPAISVPCGLDSNSLPVGLQFMGNYNDEETILNIAHQFEQETDFFGVIKKGLKNYE